MLQKGQRVELIPIKYGVVVKRIWQETVLEPPKRSRGGALPGLSFLGENRLKRPKEAAVYGHDRRAV